MLSEKEQVKEQPDIPRPRRNENEALARRSLPTKERLFLPPGYSPPPGEGSDDQERPISLNTRDPRYVPYVTKVKYAVELQWGYPDVALRHGLQGTVVLVFTILRNGQLEALQLVRSSGVYALDLEAIRAVQAASPFPPLPPSIGERKRFEGIFTYEDNRLKYDFVR